MTRWIRVRSRSPTTTTGRGDTTIVDARRRFSRRVGTDSWSGHRSIRMANKPLALDLSALISASFAEEKMRASTPA